MKLKCETWGYDFNCVHPHFWWTYTVDGRRYVKYEFLLWTSGPDDVTPKISPDGKYLYLTNKLPDRFLDAFRLLFQYDAQHLPRSEKNYCPVTMYQNAVSTIVNIKEKHEMNDIKPIVRCVLPFTCLQDFVDPYCPEGGTALRSYSHESTDKACVYIYHVSLVDASAPRAKVENKYQHINMGSAGKRSNENNYSSKSQGQSSLAHAMNTAP